MAFCPTCGNNNTYGARFCPVCGAQAPANPNQAAPRQDWGQPEPHTQAQPQQGWGAPEPRTQAQYQTAGQTYSRPAAKNVPWGDTQKSNSSFEYRNSQGQQGAYEQQQGYQQGYQQQNAQQNAYRQQNANQQQGDYNTQQGSYNQFAGSYNQNASSSNASGGNGGFFAMPEHTGFDAQDIEQNKIVAALSYIGILVIVPALSAKTSPFCRFHANQGLNVTLASMAYGLVAGIVTGVIGGIFAAIFGTAAVSAILGTLFGIVGIVFTVAAVAGIVFALTGKAKELPLAGKYKLLDKIIEKM